MAEVRCTRPRGSSAAQAARFFSGDDVMRYRLAPFRYKVNAVPLTYFANNPDTDNFHEHDNPLPTHLFR